MTNRRRIAFIGCRLSAAQTDISREYRVVRIQGANRGSVVIDGDEWDFIIVTEAERLRGLVLDRYVFLPSASALPAEKAVEMHMLARARLRPTKGDDLVARLRDTASQGSFAAIENNRYASPHEAADRIEELEAANALLSEECNRLVKFINIVCEDFGLEYEGIIKQ